MTRVEHRFGCGNGPVEALGNPDIVAANPDLLDVLSLRLQQGRISNALDARQPRIVLGGDVAAGVRKTGFDMGPAGWPIFMGGRFSGQRAGPLRWRQSVPVDQDGSQCFRPLFIGAASDRAAIAVDDAFLLTLRKTGATAPDMPGLLSSLLHVVLSQTVEASGTKQVSKLRKQQVSPCTRFRAVLGGVALLGRVTGDHERDAGLDVRARRRSAQQWFGRAGGCRSAVS